MAEIARCIQRKYYPSYLCGRSAGTTGMSRRAEAVQVVLVPKGAKAPGATYKGATQNYAKAFVAK